jgi:organic hydroperoxide reductase OsmC/OhrA
MARHAGPGRTAQVRSTRMADEQKPTHHYRARTVWSGSTGLGYDVFDRTHDASAPPAEQQLQIASDPAFMGDPRLLNPEQLLVLAASSCQLLAFLAVAARSRVDVVAYEDDATAEMPQGDPPVRITRIVLSPRITIAGKPPHEDRLRRMVEMAHRGCYIANSLRTAIVVEPTFLNVEA